MTQTAESPVVRLRSSLRGEVVSEQDDAYDESRRVWNATIDRRPLAVAMCLDEADVQAAVRFAIENGLPMAVRCGAHSMSGACVVDDGVVIDLSRMNQVRVDPEARRAHVGGGALLGDVDAATQAHGLAVPAGLVSHTGVGGLTLGGGMGWLSRLGGLTIDNLLSARVVTADGDIRTASSTENPDLFWAIRGGGGNFGVVTEFEFGLLEVGPMVHFALAFWSLEDGAAMLRHALEVIDALPDDVNVMVGGLNAPPAPFVPEQHQLQPGYVAIVVGTGAEESHAGVVAALAGGDVPPLFQFATPMPYVELQKMLDEANAWGMHCYDKGCYVDTLSDEVIDVVTTYLPRKVSPLSLVLFYRLDGAYSRPADDDTAFSGGRSPRFGAFMIGVCPVAEMLPAERDWVRSMADALAPFASDGVYVNSATDFDAANPVEEAYGAEKYARLADIKARFDPGNVFHSNADIAPR
jgi:FAD/FMN-containing dehydrogenase